MPMEKFTTVDAYIASFPDAVRVKLIELRAIIQKAAPKADEGISYGMPDYKQDGVLVYFGGFKAHISFFPTGDGVAAFANELKGFTTSKGTIQLPLDKPLPVALIKKIVAYRIAKNKEKVAAKKKKA